jgi:hypothetical protein
MILPDTSTYSANLKAGYQISGRISGASLKRKKAYRYLLNDDNNIFKKNGHSHEKKGC